MNASVPRCAAIIGLWFTTNLTAAAAETPPAKTRSIPMLVVAENYDSKKEFVSTPENLLTCAVFDAGGTISGDPMAGDAMQDAVRVAKTLEQTLTGLFSGSTGADRDLDIIYHWGLIRPIRAQLPPATKLDPNFKARLLLVDRPERVEEIEQAYVTRHTGGASLAVIAQDDMWAQTIGRADDSRYFVIISAYDHAAMVRGEGRLIWRTRVSTPEKSGPMNDVLVTLARSSREFLGVNRKHPKTFRVTLATGTASPTTDAKHPFQLAADPNATAEGGPVSVVAEDERVTFSGK